MAKRFDDKVVLIVGGTGGIGLASARKFCAEGAKLAIAGRRTDAGAAVVAELEEMGGKAVFIQADVSSTESVADMVSASVEAFGRIDVAFNNAGWLSAMVPIAEVSESEWQKMLDIKLSGVWRGMKYQIPQMVKQGGGVIINMAGNWGLVGAANFSTYCAAAHGIMGLTKSAALEYIGSGIRVNAICPGAVDAPMMDRIAGGVDEIKYGVGETLGIGRICTAEEVAGSVLFLASEDASYVNGTALVLDGGGG